MATEPPKRRGQLDKVADKTMPCTVRIPKTLHAKCKRLAAQQGRTLNNWVLQCIKKNVTE